MTTTNDKKDVELLPSMSQKSMKMKQQDKNIVPVTKGEVMKKPFLVKFAEDNAAHAWQYVVWDVLIPAVKSTIQDMVNNGLEVLFYGTEAKTKGYRRRTTTRDRNRTVISYGNYFTGNDEPRRNEPRRRELARRAGRSHDFGDILIDTRPEAEAVLDRLTELIDNYGSASVSDLLTLVGLTPSWTDEKWGWEVLERPAVVSVRGGYILDIPKPIELD